jgi:hypothetical protein
MHYLVGTIDYRINYSGYPAVLEGYSDANWISDVDELYATSGYIFTLGGAAVSWRSCKQTILMRSTMEAELAALDTAIVEGDWLCELLMDLPIIEKPLPAILMNCNNQTVIVKVDSSKDNMSVFFAPARYGVVNIVCSYSKVVLQTMKNYKAHYSLS